MIDLGLTLGFVAVVAVSAALGWMFRGMLAREQQLELLSLMHHRVAPPSEPEHTLVPLDPAPTPALLEYTEEDASAEVTVATADPQASVD